MEMKKRDTISTPSDHRSRKTGSALITAVIFAFVIAILSGTYLKLASAEHRASLRSTAYASCLNLAESGVEMGIFALNSGKTSGSTWAVKVPDFLSDSTFSGDVRYVILNATSAAPTIYAEGYMYNSAMPTVSKQVKVALSTGFQPFQKGFAARNGITFSGNGVLLDSYNSNYGEYNEDLNQAGIDADYGINGKNKNDDIYVASDRLNADDGSTSVSIGNADVYGYVEASDESRVSINANGMVTSYDHIGHDESRVSGDFYADFPVTEQPSGTYDQTYASGISGTTSVAGSSDPDHPTYYNISDISLSGNAGNILSITGHVVFVLSGDIEVKGSASISIQTDSSVEVYTANDVAIGGNGITNTDGTATDFEIFGTAAMDGDDAGQDIKVAGNGQLAASVYAPNADVSLNGGGTDGEVLGGVVALTATITGGSAFHFDEALRGITDGDGTYSVDRWLEMTGLTTESTPHDLSNYFVD